MTLIHSFACKGYVLQVSDRRVTHKGKVFDSLANKAIVYVGADGVMSVAYTGLAYIDEVHTDQWMAEILSGRRTPAAERPQSPSLHVGTRIRRPELGVALQLIRQELASRIQGPRLSGPGAQHEVVAIGWYHGRRKAARPFL